MTRDERRSYAEGEALEAGLDDGMAAAAVDMIMGSIEDSMDDDSFEEVVADMIQRHAMP